VKLRLQFKNIEKKYDRAENGGYTVATHGCCAARIGLYTVDLNTLGERDEFLFL